MTAQGGTRSLAWECWEASDGDPEIALLLALDFQRLIRDAAQRIREPGPKAQEAAHRTSSDTHASANTLLQGSPPGSLTDELAA